MMVVDQILFQILIIFLVDGHGLDVYTWYGNKHVSMC